MGERTGWYVTGCGAGWCIVFVFVCVLTVRVWPLVGVQRVEGPRGGGVGSGWVGFADGIY